MQRETWTDERLDDLSRRMDQGFERVDKDLRELRTELRTELGSQIGSARSEIGELRGLIHRFGAGIIGSIVVAILLHAI